MTQSPPSSTPAPIDLPTGQEPLPVRDWETDFDHTHPDYAAAAPEIWEQLRQACPVAHTQRFGGTWLPVRHADVEAIAHDTVNYTSQGVIVGPRPEVDAPMGPAPPITSDPPFHAIARRLLLPPFAPKPIAALEASTRAYCHELIDNLLAKADENASSTDTAIADAAIDYAQNIPVRVIANMLGLPEHDAGRFRTFIHRVIEAPGQAGELPHEETLDYYLDTQVAEHRANPRSPEDGDLIDYLLSVDIDGMPLLDEHARGTIALLLIAGIDTTWSAIGASLWHLAENPADRRRWIEDPDVRPFAIEEFLRFCAPVTMARIAATDHELSGCPVQEGNWVLLPFPAANRDPEVFEDADTFVIDRKVNRHTAFGLGIHRCLGSNLARLEVSVAIETWMERLPEFELLDPALVRWSTGQVRGPRVLPVRLIR
ncbi:MAG: cytochrome P450 [Actinomycetota bacterium]|nr:cytochrome P450 [Actinomycetota bacterium]